MYVLYNHTTVQLGGIRKKILRYRRRYTNANTAIQIRGDDHSRTRRRCQQPVLHVGRIVERDLQFQLLRLCRCRCCCCDLAPFSLRSLRCPPTITHRLIDHIRRKAMEIVVYVLQYCANGGVDYLIRVTPLGHILRPPQRRSILVMKITRCQSQCRQHD